MPTKSLITVLILTVALLSPFAFVKPLTAKVAFNTSPAPVAVLAATDPPEESIPPSLPPLLTQENEMAIPLFTQTRNLSCEAAAIRMILSYTGIDIEEDKIQSSFPKNSNPHKGFRGNVNGPVWGFDDYGVYAEVVAQTLNNLGLPATAYQNLSQEELKEKVLIGKPAIIWVNIANPDPKLRTIKINDEEVKLISGEHTVVIRGYKNNQWIINDPWVKTSSKGEKLSETFSVTNLDDIYWDWFDHMAVIID